MIRSTGRYDQILFERASCRFDRRSEGSLRPRSYLVAGFVVWGALMTVGSPIAMAVDSWTYWRGPNGQGVAPAGEYPVDWQLPQDATWSIELEGRGSSTPVISGSDLYVTTGLNDKNQLMALDVASGQVKWQVTLGDDRGGKNAKGSGSNPSPVTDGRRIYAYYRSGDLACVDADGNKLWHRNLQDEFGEDTLWWDLGSSPLLTESGLIVAVMQSPPSPSYLAAFDLETGEILWKADRDLGAPSEAAQSYTSPSQATVNGQDYLVVLGADHLTLHDPADGQIVAKLGGFNPEQNEYFRSISSPVVAGNLVVCPYARGDTLTCVDMAKLLAGEGERSIVWEHDDIGADVPTPSIADDTVYLCSDKGPVRAIDLQTGEVQWAVDLPPGRGQIYSSPLIAGGHLYVLREVGTLFVLKLPEGGGSASLVAEHTLPESNSRTVASPIPVEGGLIFRTSDHLIRIDR